MKTFRTILFNLAVAFSIGSNFPSDINLKFVLLYLMGAALFVHAILEPKQ